MATASSLISQIQTIVHSLTSIPFYMYSSALGLRIGLRNLNVLLVCLRNTGDEMQSLFSRIEDLIGRIPTPDDPNPSSDVLDDVQRVVNCLTKEVIDDWHTDTMKNRLTLDDVVEIVESILHNTVDFSELGLDELPDPAALRGVMDEFEVQARFSRDSLLFAKGTGVEDQQIQILLIHIRPFVMDAALGFMTGGFFAVEEIQQKCPKLDLQVFQAYTQTLLSISSLDQTNHDVLKDFLGSLISLLWHLLRYERHPNHFDSLKALYEDLRLSRGNLKKQQEGTNNGDFEEQIGVLIRDAGVVICSLYHTDVAPPCLSDLLQRFDVLQPQVPPESNSSEATALDFGDSTIMEDISIGKARIEIAMASHQSSGPSGDVGFQEYEVNSIFNRLERGSKQLRFVPISGMAGLGKTAFALKVYNLRPIIYHFQARAWCTITQVFNKRSVLHQLLNQIQPGDYSYVSEDDLADKLRRSLKRKRYLIFLDDVWTPQVWESLRPSFPDDATQSRILLTSRLHHVIPHALPDEQPHFLRMRTENECLEIIEMKLMNKVGLTVVLEKFAKLCKGLPLTAVLVAGLLATTVQEGWEGILNHLSSGGISHMEQCKIVLEFSYNNLPDALKFCFIYFGAFPEDKEIYAEKLVRMWMAEGFVEGKNDQRLKDVAQECLDNLIQRNLVMVAKKTALGVVKTCRIHDLLHDFCLMKGMQKKLFHLLLQRRDDLSDFNEPCNLERLSIYSTAHHFKDSRLFCPLAHSMLFFNQGENPRYCRLSDMLFIVHVYKLLKVLDMDVIWFSAAVPSEIALLTQLTFLSICCSTPVIPSSIGNLSNLETLIIKLFAVDAVSLPCTIWDLQKLKYLHITKTYGYYGFSLPLENIDDSPSLLELEVICGIQLHIEGMEKQMRKFPNIRKLKGSVESSEELNNIVVVPECLSELESLNLFAESVLQYQFDFGSSCENLKKVTLKWFVLSREEIAVLGKLPNLGVLKLISMSFLGGTMEIEEGEFPKVRILVLRDSSSLETLTAVGDEQLPCLEKLVFRSCAKLKEIPDTFLETSLTLEEIEVSYCSPSLGSLVRNIQLVQEDFGNSIKVKVHPYSE